MKSFPYEEILKFSKCFSQDECNKFAELSGDYNRLHTDPRYARRTIAGGAAVHGLYLTLYALDITIETIGAPTQISTKFKDFVNTSDQVDFSLLKNISDPGRWRVVGSVYNTVSVIIDILTIADSKKKQQPVPNGFRDQITVKPFVPEVPSATDSDEYFGKFFSYDLTGYKLTSCPFARLIDSLGEATIHAMLSMTHFVGMICPGESSVFSQFDISLGKSMEGSHRQYFRLLKLDERIHRFTIETSGVFEGRLIAFTRPEPVCQKHISHFETVVSRLDFKDLHALVIGGSRGLGAAAAKILAFGGAKVDVTYVECNDTAQSILKEISEYADIKPRIFRYDVLKDDPELIAEQLYSANFILYFATPRIRAGTSASFDVKLYNVYLSYYVERLLNVASYAALAPTKPQVFFAPSSMFVETRKAGFAEYTLAKMAMEFLFDAQNAKASRTKFVYYRFPQMKTDQTASLFSQNFVDTFSTLYTVLLGIKKSHG